MLVLAGAAQEAIAAAPNGRSQLLIPVENPLTDEAITNVSIGMTSYPSWMSILPASILGPVDIAARSSATFDLELQVSPPATPGMETIGFDVHSDTSAYSCVLTSFDSFATFRTECSRAGATESFLSTLLSDRTPPQSTLEISGPIFVSSEATFAALDSKIFLTATDQIVEGEAWSNVAAIEYSLDPPSTSAPVFQSYTGPISLGEGRHSLVYRSRDSAGNIEASHVRNISIDASPPAVEIVISGTHASDGRGNYSMTSADQLTISTLDPERVGVASGVSFAYLAVDGSTMNFLEPISLSSGVHMLVYRAVDNVSNASDYGIANIFVDFPIDSTPPSTSFSVPGAIDLGSNTFHMVVGSTITLSAEDGPVNSASGVSRTLFFIDVNPSACGSAPLAFDPAQRPGTCGNPIYSGPFTIEAGTHTLSFYSEDFSGNTETVKTINLVIGGHVGDSVHGNGIATDDMGAIWAISTSENGLIISKTDPLSSASVFSFLPNGDSAFPWSIQFDVTGSAYAIGSVLGSNGADLVGVVRVSRASGDVLSTFTFDSGFQNNNFVFASVPGWTVGGIQTYGPIDTNQEGPRSISAAIWKTDFSHDLVQLTTTYSRAGFDVATGAAIDADGNIWIVGFSESPNPRSARVFDLAVWKYSSDGRTLLAGPYLREGYLENFDTNMLARIQILNGVAYVVAPRAHSARGTDLGFVSFETNSGAVLAESAWRSADGASSFPSGLFPEPNVGLKAFGGLGYDDGTLGALWEFDADGSFRSAETLDSGGIRAAVSAGTSLWTVVDGSTNPFLVSETASLGVNRVDVRAPRTSVSATSPLYQGALLYLSSSTQITLPAVDDGFISNDGAGVGVTQTFYSIDAQGYAVFESSFQIVSGGTHTLHFYSLDREGNAEVVKSTIVAVDITPPNVVLVSSGPLYSIIAADPVINGAASGIAQINYLVDVSPDSCHDVNPSSSAPRGTCANLEYGGPFALAQGTHTVFFQALDNLGNGADLVLSSAIVVMSTSAAPVYVLTPSSGPVGIPFGIAGPGFGAYAGANTRVKFGTTIAPVSVWNDTAITGTVPGLSTGSYAVTVERQSGSTVTVVSVGTFELTQLAPSSLAPLSGPIGVPFSIGGPGFGPYAGTLTRVLFDGTTAPLSVWNDSAISGTVPNVPPGSHAIWIERATSGGGLESSDTAYFTVTAPAVASLSPSSGPVGVAFALAGQSFGPYAGTLTQVLFGGTTAAISVWNDTAIAGTIPGALTPATYPVQVARRTSDGGLSLSNTVYFQVTGLFISSSTPLSGPVGLPFTLSGAGFGAYAGTNTRLLLGGTTVAVSVWNDSTISGPVPTVPAGSQPLWIERLGTGGLESSNTVYFQVVVPSVTGVSPSSGPIGIAFTLSGSGFGSYAGTNTQVLIAGTTAPISVWNDVTISGTIPGSIPTGVQTVVVSRRGSDGGTSLSAPAYFQVTGMSVDSLSPSTGPIGIPFTIHGSQFGTYNGTNTRVRFGAVTAAISVWNNATITGTIPALPVGAYTVAVERQQGSNVALSNYSTFTVTDYTFTGLTPSSGPIGVPFTITGSGFGPYNGTNTRVLIGGATAAISVWNDAQISGTVPPVPAGSQPMWIERQTTGGVQSSDTTYFEITVPTVYSLAPSSAPIGAPFTLHGTSFGPYNGTNTRVKFNGTAAPISVWNDALITGSIPGALSTGPAVMVVERVSGPGLVQSATQAFLVLQPTISTVAPASGTSGTAVTLSGFGFGPYAGTATKLLVGGSTVAVAVWNDSTIRWTVPSSMANGTYPVVVVRSPSGGTIQSDPVNFTVGTGVSALFAAAPLSSQPDVRFQGDMSLPASEGGRIETPAQAAVDVPPGALDQDTEITLAREKEAFKTDRRAALSRDGLGEVGEAIQFGPEGTRFAHPVSIELPYDSALVPAGKLGEIAINYYDPVAKTWTPLLTQVDARRHVLSAKTDHFSLYQPLGHGIRPAAGALQFADVYVFPNPARGARAVTIRAQPGAADSVSVRVYDLAGRKVYESSAFTVSGGNYDNVWDIGGVASGVYTYVVTAKKAGQADIRASGRIGVIK